MRRVIYSKVHSMLGVLMFNTLAFCFNFQNIFSLVVGIFMTYTLSILFPFNALDKLPPFFDRCKDVQLENTIFIIEICKHWDEVHWYEKGWYLVCPKKKTIYSKIKSCNYLQFTFIPSTMKENLSYRECTK